MDSLEIEVQITQEDYINYYKHSHTMLKALWKASKQAANSRLSVKTLSIALMLVPFFLFLSIYPVQAFFGGAGFVYAFFFNLILAHVISKDYHQRLSMSFMREQQISYDIHRYKFDDVGIHMTSSQGNATIKWRAISDIVTVKQFIIFASFGNYHIFIPTRYFTDKQEQETFVSALQKFLV